MMYGEKLMLASARELWINFTRAADVFASGSAEIKLLDPGALLT
jgi:hypothetical protein